MSYILDALRKAERQRHAGPVPTLGTEHPAAQSGWPRWPWTVAALVAVAGAGAVSVIGPWRSAVLPATPRPAAVVAAPSPAPRAAPVPAQDARQRPVAPASPRGRRPPGPVASVPSAAAAPKPLKPAPARPDAGTVAKPIAPPGEGKARPKAPEETPVAAREPASAAEPPIAPVAPGAPADQASADAVGTAERSPGVPAPPPPRPAEPAEGKTVPGPVADPRAASVAPPSPTEANATGGDAGTPGQEAARFLAEAVAKLKLDVLVYSDAAAQRMVFIDGRKYLEGQVIDGRLVLERITEEGAVLAYRGQHVLLRPKLNPYARP